MYELLEQTMGIELAAVVAPFGGGKSTIAQRIATVNPRTVLVYFEPRFSISGLIRELAFQLAGVRPRMTDACVELIQEQMARQRRLFMIDESDQMSIKHLNQLRAFHDRYSIPVVFFGEDSLIHKLSREGRLISRVRKVIKLEPVSQAEVVIFYRQSLGASLKPEYAAKLIRHAAGDYRKVVVDAAKAERIMLASGLKQITDGVVKEICK
jgi:DNA transposition AAA+ family ATPase